MKPLRTIFFLTGLLAGFLMAAFPVGADHGKFPVWTRTMNVDCAEAAHIDHDIRTMNLAAPITRGQLNDGSVMSIYTNKDSSMWAITISNPSNGRDCLVLAGKGLVHIPWVLGKGG